MWLAALALIVALGFGLRITGLGRQSLWYDEGVSAYLTTLSLPEMTRWTAEDIQPPLYYYLLAGWTRLFGRSEIALRWPSLLFSVLTIPLAWYAGRRLLSAAAGLLGALFFAISPLYIWYAQEARNYALLTFLGLLSSALMLDLAPRRGAGASRPAWRWAVYVATLAAALYTHYFAAFLILFQVAFYLGAWRQARGTARQLGHAGAAWAVTGLLYLPWIPHLIGRYGRDQSYWEGALKLGEALRKVAISFSLGESVLEPIGWPLSLGFMALLVLSWVFLWRAGKGRSVAFLALYLVVPVAGTLLLASRTPKFNPRYLMPASPAFLLSLAIGVAGLYEGRKAQRTWPARAGMLAVGAIALGFILGGFGYSDRNLYSDPAFTKADFRGVVEYLRAHRGPDEGIILLSGHMYPVFDYYLPGSGRILLPAERTLSVERVLGYEAGEVLNEELAGKSGVWVVRWQDDVVDPNGLLELLLEGAGEQQPVEARFWHIRLDHYLLPPDARFATSPEIQHETAADFGGLVRLLGWSQPWPDSYVLYWEALQPLAEDLAISLRLVDDRGVTWGGEDRRPASYLYPTTRWEPGEVVFGRGQLVAEPGTPPGEYFLQVRVYSQARPDGYDRLDARGAPQGRVISLGPFVLQEAGRAWDVGQLPAALALEGTWSGAIALYGRGELPSAVDVGGTLIVETIWSAVAASDEPLQGSLRLEPLGAEGTRTPLDVPLSLMKRYPTTRWQPGEWLRSRDVVRIPAAWPGGATRLSLIVRRPSGAIEPRISLGEVDVQVPARDFRAPEVQIPSGAMAGRAARLLGISLEPAAPAPGEPFAVTVYWQPTMELDTSYTVFVHLLDGAGRIIDQHDGIPAEGTRPSTGWLPGEVIADRYTFDALPDGGGASLAIGLYDAGMPGMPRLDWTDEDGRPIGDALHLPVPSGKLQTQIR